MNGQPPAPDSAEPAETTEAAAAAWLSLRDRGMSAAETAEFMRWLQQDPQHAAVFAELDTVWKEFDRLGAVPAEPATAASADPDLLAPRDRRRRHRPALWLALGAAAALVLLLGGLLRPSARSHETAVGAFQKIDLPDGSVAQLNTDSAFDFSFAADSRRVRVARGEVYFTVAPDAARPFVVTVGPVAVRALGTAFNVRRDAETVDVLVTEGRVRVDDARRGNSLLASAAAAEPAVLAAGERVTVTVAAAPAAAPVAKVSAAETQRLLAWQERRLEFDAAPLAAAVREFNRYNRQQLVIADPALAAKRFSGSFRADGYETFVRLLEADFGVRAERGDDGIVLRAAATDGIPGSR